MGPDDKSNLVLVFGTMSELKVNMDKSPLDLRELLELLLKSLSDVVSFVQPHVLWQNNINFNKVV